MMRTLTIAGLVVFLAVVLVPFWWIASMAFKTYEQIQFATSIYVPRPFTWENYTGLWTDTRFPLWLRNSLVTALVVTATTTVVASLGGYAVARLRFPGRERGRFPSTPSSSAMAGDSSPGRSGYIRAITAADTVEVGINWLTG